MDKLYVPYISTESVLGRGKEYTEEEIERGFKTKKLFMKFIGEHNLKKRLYDSLIQKVWCKGQINFSTFIYLPGDAFQMNVQPMLPYISKGERYGFWIDYDYGILSQKWRFYLLEHLKEVASFKEVSSCKKQLRNDISFNGTKENKELEALFAKHSIPFQRKELY